MFAVLHTSWTIVRFERKATDAQTASGRLSIGIGPVKMVMILRLGVAIVVIISQHHVLTKERRQVSGRLVGTRGRPRLLGFIRRRCFHGRVVTRRHSRD